MRGCIRALVLLALFFIAALFSGCAAAGSNLTKDSAGSKEQEHGLLTIDKDAVWSGSIRVTGDVYVKEGATLTIQPGTVIRFDTIGPKLDKDGGRNMVSLEGPYFPSAEIIVRGRLIAVGTKERPITFKSSDKGVRPGAWGAINLLGSNGNMVEYCRIYDAYIGVHSHASTVIVMNNRFSNNGTAVQFNKEGFDNPCVMFIEHNTMTGNLSGISARNATADIAFNDISDNKFYGIWIKENTNMRVEYNDIKGNAKGIYFFRAPSTRIRHNNILGNKEYNIEMAVDSPNDVDASNNWWGATDARNISATFYDKDMDESLGRVIFEPVATDAIRILR